MILALCLAAMGSRNHSTAGFVAACGLVTGLGLAGLSFFMSAYDSGRCGSASSRSPGAAAGAEREALRPRMKGRVNPGASWRASSPFSSSPFTASAACRAHQYWRRLHLHAVSPLQSVVILGWCFCQWR